MCQMIFKHQWYLKYFPGDISLLFDFGQLWFQTNTLLPVHLGQTLRLFQLVLQYLVKTNALLSCKIKWPGKSHNISLHYVRVEDLLISLEIKYKYILLNLIIATENKLLFSLERGLVFFCTFSPCWASGWGSGGSMEVLLLSLCVRPSGVLADPAFLFPFWWDSSSLSSRSFSDIQFFSWDRESNFSLRKSFVLSYNRFCVRSSLVCQMKEANFELSLKLTYKRQRATRSSSS